MFPEVKAYKDYNLNDVKRLFEQGMIEEIKEVIEHMEEDSPSSTEEVVVYLAS
jgi:hypothetical protein